jgi:hypothetical protein
MTPGDREADIRRVRSEIVDRLRSSGIEATHRDSPEDLVRLLDAVQEFERTVERKGGDLMVDEPIASSRPSSPDDNAFVLPARREHESAAELIERIAQARGRAAQAPRRA